MGHIDSRHILSPIATHTVPQDVTVLTERWIYILMGGYSWIAIGLLKVYHQQRTHTSVFI